MWIGKLIPKNEFEPVNIIENKVKILCKMFNWNKTKTIANFNDIFDKKPTSFIRLRIFFQKIAERRFSSS